MSSFTAVSGDKLNEIINDNNIKIAFGDQKISAKNSPTQNLTSQVPIIPNSRGDCFKNLPNIPETNLEVKNQLFNKDNIKIADKDNKKFIKKDTFKDSSHVNTIKTEITSNNNNDAISLKQIEFRRHLQAVETLEKIIELEDSSEFADTRGKKLLKFVPELNEECDDNVYNESFNEIEKNIENLNYEVDSKNVSSESDDYAVTKDLPGKVNKIIKRVEDIYTQLEDIQLEVSFYLICQERKR